MLKSHKVRQAPIGGEDLEDEAPRRRHRKMTLAQLEKRVVRRRASTAAGGMTNVLRNAGAMMRQAGVMVQRLNQEMAKSTRSMPSDKQINKEIWG